MGETTEAELVGRIRRRDSAAFQTILGRQLPSVSRYVARMTGNAAEAEDITQEVFLRLWERASAFDPSKAKLSTWLHNIAHNLCIDHFRKQRRLVGEPPSDDYQLSLDEPDEAFLQQLASEDIKRALLALPESQRSALILCYYQGLSNRDAAEALSVSIEALESVLARGRRKLKSLLAQSGNETIR